MAFAKDSYKRQSRKLVKSDGTAGAKSSNNFISRLSSGLKSSWHNRHAAANRVSSVQSAVNRSSAAAPAATPFVAAPLSRTGVSGDSFYRNSPHYKDVRGRDGCSCYGLRDPNPYSTTPPPVSSPPVPVPSTSSASKEVVTSPTEAYKEAKCHEPSYIDNPLYKEVVGRDGKRSYVLRGPEVKEVTPTSVTPTSAQAKASPQVPKTPVPKTLPPKTLSTGRGETGPKRKAHKPL